MQNLLVRTKFDWSWSGGPVLIMRTMHTKFDIYAFVLTFDTTAKIVSITCFLISSIVPFSA